MTAVTQQKADMRDILQHMVMDRYDNMKAEDRRSAMASMTSRYVCRMTLGELQAWHRSLVFTEMMRNKHTPTAEVSL